MILLLLLIALVKTLSSNITILQTNILSPIDVILLPNSNFLIANQSSLFVFHINNNTISPLSLPIKYSIINLVSLQKYIAICTKQAIYLYDFTFMLSQTQSLSALKQYSRIAVIQNSNDIFYIPFSKDSLQFEQSKINSTSKRKFINQNNLQTIIYLSGHQFVLSADQIGNVALYNTSSTVKTDSAKLCDQGITHMQAIEGSPSLVITCQNISFIVAQNHSLVTIQLIPYIGYSLATIQQSYLLMINSTSLLLNNKTHTYTMQIGNITNVIHAYVITSLGLTVYAFDDNGTILIIDVKMDEDDSEGNGGLQVWQIAAIASGGAILLLIFGFVIKKRMKAKKQSSYESSQESQLSLKLLKSNDQY